MADSRQSPAMQEFPPPPSQDVPPSPDAPKKQATRRPWYIYAGFIIVIILGLAFVGNILGAPGATDDKPPGATEDKPQGAPNDKPCVDRAEFEAAHDRASQAMADAAEAIKSGRVAPVVPYLRDAADAWQDTAEAVAADPNISQQLSYIGRQFDSAADAAEQRKLAVMQERVGHATVALQAAQSAMIASPVPEC